MDVYANSLIRGLKVVRPDWEIIERSPTLAVASTRQSDLLAGGQKYYERYWHYPRTLKNLEADIFHVIDHSDGYLNYWLKRDHRPSVTTCHDLINIIRPETFQGQASFPLVSMTAWKIAIQGMTKSDRIIAVSSHTKKDTINHLAIPDQNITVVHNGVDPIFRQLPQDSINDFRCKQGLSEDKLCLLNVGSNNARKNIITALKALAVLNSQGLPVVFWKAGDDFSGEQKIFIKEHHLESCVTYLGQPDEETLVKIYNAADVLLVPSLYEGFGLTVLEAMACGTAVITTNVSSLPEVAGNAAILTDPLDVEGIAKAIQQLYARPWERKELVRKGLERVKQFTWENTAEHVAHVYEEVLN
jgi:glycosyltransferase involved in cell wall biosynthesis